MSLSLNSKQQTFSPLIAKVLGLDCSILIQIIHFKLRNTTINTDNIKWICNSYNTLSNSLDNVLSARRIGNAVRKLEKLGVLVNALSNKNKLSRTKYYTINYSILCKILANNKCSATSNFSCPSFTNVISGLSIDNPRYKKIVDMSKYKEKKWDFCVIKHLNFTECISNSDLVIEDEDSKVFNKNDKNKISINQKLCFKNTKMKLEIESQTQQLPIVLFSTLHHTQLVCSNNRIKYNNINISYTSKKDEIKSIKVNEQNITSVLTEKKKVNQHDLQEKIENSFVENRILDKDRNANLDMSLYKKQFTNKKEINLSRFTNEIKMLNLWNELVWSKHSTEEIGITRARLYRLKIVYRDWFDSDMSKWKDRLEAISKNEFLMGKSKIIFHARLDWIIKGDILQRMKEGEWIGSQDRDNLNKNLNSRKSNLENHYLSKDIKLDSMLDFSFDIKIEAKCHDIISDKIKEKWRNILIKLRKHYGSAVYRNWFDKLKLISVEDKNITNLSSDLNIDQHKDNESVFVSSDEVKTQMRRVIISAPTNFIKNWVDTYYKNKMFDLFVQELSMNRDRLSIDFIVNIDNVTTNIDSLSSLSNTKQSYVNDRENITGTQKLESYLKYNV